MKWTCSQKSRKEVRHIPEEKKGRVKITVESEINEPLMEIIKEAMANMPQMMQLMAAQQKKKE